MGILKNNGWLMKKTDVDKASSVSFEEQNSLPSEEDSGSLLSDRTSFLSETDGSDADPFFGENENPNNYTGLKLKEMSHADSKMMTGSECNGSPNMGSPNTVEDLIHSDDENLKSPDNHTVVEVMTAKGVEDSISKSTVDMVLVSRNEIEQDMDFSAPGEAQESLITETDIELNPEQVKQEAEQIISDGDKADPKLNREQANQEAKYIISDGDKADSELNGEQAIQEVEQIILAGDIVDPELSPEQVNQEAEQIISDVFSRALLAKAVAEFGVKVVIGKVKSVAVEGDGVAVNVDSGGVKYLSYS
nr:FAD/NAD(P)-binding domain-containing protein [Tanacetum cinerariifolium]